MNSRQIGLRVVAATFAIAVAATLTGCFSNPLDALGDKVSEGIAEGGAEKLVEDMTGGELDIEIGELPADFPSEVPLVSEKVLSSTTIDTGDGGKSTMVIVSDDRELSEVADQVKSDFSGWEEIMWQEMAAEMYTGQYSNGAYGVLVGVMPGDDEQGTTVVSYSVHPQAPEE